MSMNREVTLEVIEAARELAKLEAQNATGPIESLLVMIVSDLTQAGVLPPESDKRYAKALREAASTIPRPKFEELAHSYEQLAEKMEV